MIIGNGDIARIINDREGFVFLACGTSNRRGAITYADFIREKSRVSGFVNSMPVYFSTLSIYYDQDFSDYTHYKRNMERHIKENYENYCIVRIGNITWGDNPNTLINHLRKDQSRIDDTYRYLVTKEELNHWLGLIPTTGKHEMNITGERVKVSEIVRRINAGEL